MKHYLFLVMAVSFVGSSLAKAPKDPSHGGKPLSTWVREIAADEQGEPFFNTNAVEAIRKIGTNGLPWLLTELKANDSQMGAAARAIRGMDMSSGRNRRAAQALKILGPMAAPAVPDFTKIVMDEVGYSNPREKTLSILPYLGDAAIPIHQAMLKSKSMQTRSMAAHELGYFGPKAAVAVPDLLIALRDPAAVVQCAAAGSLGPIRSHPEKVIPLLIQDYQGVEARYAPYYRPRVSGNWPLRPRNWHKRRMKTLTDATLAPDIPVADLVMEFRLRAAYSLGKYGPQASEALPILDAELSRLTSGANHAAMNRKRKPEFERVLKKAIAQIRNGE